MKALREHEYQWSWYVIMNGNRVFQKFINKDNIVDIYGLATINSRFDNLIFSMYIFNTLLVISKSILLAIEVYGGLFVSIEVCLVFYLQIFIWIVSYVFTENQYVLKC